MLVHQTPVPPCGWNSYDSYSIFINEQEAIANIDAFIRLLKPHGYEYFVIDACWYRDGGFMDHYREYKCSGPRMTCHIDQWGRFIPSPVQFPHGLRALADRCHAGGIKFGLHLMRGLPALAIEQNTPVKGAPGIHARDIADFSNPSAWPAPYMGAGIDMSKPGAQEYYDSVVEYMTEELTVDFLKYDDIQEYPEEYEAVARAIEKVSRPVVLSISPGTNTSPLNWKRLAKAANMVRITGDIWDGECSHWREKLDRWELMQGLGSPDCWIDLDMLPIGGIQANIPEDTPEECIPVWGVRRKSYNTLAQNQMLMAQMALARSPLFYGGDLPMSDEQDIALVTNPDMLECNRCGEGAQLVCKNNLADVRRSFRQGSRSSGWIGIFNIAAYRKDFRFTTEELGLPGGFPAAFTNVWTGEKIIPENGFLSVSIPSWESLFLKF